MRLEYQPHPLNPSLLGKERGRYYIKRGFASLKLSYLPEILGVFKRGVSPSYYYFPFPLVRGRGYRR
jgi:hypothetical protein